MSKSCSVLRSALVAAALSPLMSNPLSAQTLSVAPAYHANTIFQEVMVDPEPGAPDARREAALRRQIVDYPTHEAAGTIVIDTPNTYLYYVLGGSKAIRYGIGVGREGFKWSGVKSIDRKAEWPDWVPPAEMIARQPYLPRFMAGGEGNPLGARAMYLGGTMYRIHGTNAPDTIGHHVSSGCIRMMNSDVMDLYERAKIGTKVVVLPDTRGPHYAARAQSLDAQAAALNAPRTIPQPRTPLSLSQSSIY